MTSLFCNIKGHGLNRLPDALKAERVRRWFKV